MYPTTSCRALIAIPCYNEAERLPQFLSNLVEATNRFSPQRVSYDFVLVDDGSRPEHAQIHEEAVIKAQQLLAKPHSFQYFRISPNQGKGHALYTIFSHALRGELGPENTTDGKKVGWGVVGFLDADGATDIKEFHRLSLFLLEDPELAAVLGSRVKMLGYQVERQGKRHYAGRIFATFVSEMFDIPVYDSQCGAKVFRTSRLNQSDLELCYNPRWLFDTQLVIWNHHVGRKQLEVPVNWSHIDDSKVSLLRDPIKMLWGLWSFRKKIKAQNSEGART